MALRVRLERVASRCSVEVNTGLQLSMQPGVRDVGLAHARHKRPLA
jgi:hypothetical protein